MIEESERRLLFKSAYNSHGLPIVEFGAFFGASALALAEGLAAKYPLGKQKVLCIDAFEVGHEDAFHKHVILFAERCNKKHLLQDAHGKTAWIEITKLVTREQQERISFHEGIVDNGFNATVLPHEIGLLHLDLPKDASTMLPILRSAFPRLARNSIIAFQDYAYQFSNELIAYFELLEESSIIVPIGIAASSIFFRVVSPEPNAIDWEFYLSTALEHQHSLIQKAISRYKGYPQARAQEIIALKAAQIRSLTYQSISATFSQQEIVRSLITDMIRLNPDRAAFVLAEVITENIGTPA
ncbi:class I SAM-dependent methyltransferase [Cyanobium sp. Aljojuca 7D2]|uniref:class I SAM-dependent methyltransferase n=1 Tax=Cyanobium sp. Aljojuca 7D2 TaxID=2823698 RepID=UPI0020CE54FD|nr:class I SAM-dependent methyltransferase [Cyanobium sp. Aljojuca 7D2]MCP9890259.1 class I SAM-dependent methyltransferase [Cyanobium sp. Aljojuca 7D2]